VRRWRQGVLAGDGAEDAEAGAGQRRQECSLVVGRCSSVGRSGAKEAWARGRAARGGGGRAREFLTGVEARFGWGEPRVRLLVEPWVQVMDP
jgi:hypothetical protein